MEVELKLAVPAGAVAAVLAHPALRPLKRGRVRRTRLVSTYFDTADDLLAQRQLALRVRKSGRHWVQTVKGPATPGSGGGLAERPEDEWPLAGGRAAPAPDLALLADTPHGRSIAKLARKQPLRPRFTTDFVRTTVPLAFPDSTMAHVALDVGHVRAAGGRRRRAAISELEIELEAGDPARLFELALALAADLPLRVEVRSKAERGYDLVGPQPHVPARAEPVEFDTDAGAAGAFAAILRNCLRQIERNAQGVGTDDDPEWIHQMRVGMRRIRSALSLARPLLAPSATAHLVDDLRWLAGELGPARDLDVFVDETLPAMRGAAQDALATDASLDHVVAPLAARASVRRAQARRDAKAAVASPRFQRMLLSAGMLAVAPQAWSGPVAVPAAEFAMRVLKRRHRKLREAGKSLAALAPGERHAARIAAKKLRYAAEFLAPCFPGKRARAYRRALSDLQEVLGKLNDTAVAAALASEIAEPSSPAATLVAGWALARAQSHGPALDKSWKAFRDAKPFWTG